MEKDEQWALVAQKLALVESTDCPKTVLRLEESWRAGAPPWPGVPRESGPRVAEYVLAAIDAHTEMGYYPPPELMLALSALLNEYLDGKGKLSLEEVFFGKPRRRTGSFAVRSVKHGRDLFTDAVTRAAAKGGQSEGKVGDILESVSALVFRRTDAESLLRAKRRANAREKPKKPKRTE